jgi:hypothetical protein
VIARYFAFGRETAGQRQALAQAAVGLMFAAIKPLGVLVARQPVGPDHPDVMAGASFGLPYGPASRFRTAAGPGCASPSASTSSPPSPSASSRLLEQT